MAIVPIRIVGDPVLHTPTQPVPVGPDGSLPDDLPELIANMYETMDAANGVGLAANQIGVPLDSSSTTVPRPAVAALAIVAW
ncbi:Peptide deformylase [Mycobacteroides abscessus]|nr:Peptide deformylase [Mycobacteroides abscessus]